MLEAAGLVTTVVRDSDVVGRISANELCVLLIDDSSEPPKAWERIQLALTAHNAGVIGVAPLELEGQVRYHRPDQPAAIDDLLSEESPARPERARRTRVLVIGPPEDAGIAAASFPPDDYSIFTTASGLEGGRLAVLERPDIVLLELSLPDVPGHSVLRRLREESATASLPVVLLTRPSDGYGEFEARRAGAQGVLVKPFNPAACRLAVHAALRGESPEAPAS